MALDKSQQLPVEISYKIKDNLEVDEILKSDLHANFLINNFQTIKFRDLQDQKCRAKITNFLQKDNKIVIECILQYDIKPIKKYKVNKYHKQHYDDLKTLRMINFFGINQAQILHSKDVFIDEYIPIETYLKNKLPTTFEVKLYELTLDGTYEIFRHKNLFSEYRDEISDFEKLTYIRKDKLEDVYFLSHKLDQEVLSYDHKSMSLQRRKEARNLAKTIYQMINGFAKFKLINLLKNKNVFIKTTITIDRLDKRAYQGIEIAQMSQYTLSNAFNNYIKAKKQLKNKHYKPYRLQNKQKRYTKSQQIQAGVIDYDEEIKEYANASKINLLT